MPGIAAFYPGEWNDQKWTEADVKAMFDNFKKFSTPANGKPAWYVPYISVNHNETPATKDLRFGELSGATLGRGNLLSFDADKVPAEIGAMVNGKQLAQPSLEIITPKRDAAGKIVSGFVGPDGKVVETPVVKCLTFLGSQVPGVKGLPPLPTAVFRDTGGITHKFGALSTMPRDQLIAALRALGVPESMLTDAVPDADLQALLTAVQALNANPPGGNTPPAPDPNSMADIGSGGGVAGAVGAAGTAAGVAGAVGGATTQPSQVVVKYNDVGGVVAKFNQQFPGFLDSLNNQIHALTLRVGAVDRIAANAVLSAKDAVITSFFRDCGLEGSGQVTPEMQATLKPIMMNLDHTTVHKFSDNSGQGTALEAAVKAFKSSLPVVRDPRRKMQQTTPNNPPVGGGNGGTFDAERRRKVLSASAAGRQVLAKEAASGKK